MQSFVVPVAPVWAQITVGVPLVLVAGAGLRWGVKGVGLSWRVARGLAPTPPGSTAALSGGLGMAFYGVAIAGALGCGALFLQLLGAPATLVDDAGITARTSLFGTERTFIAWRDVSAVDCGIPPRTDAIRRLVVRTKSATVELGNAGRALEPVRAFIEQHTPPGTVRPCRREWLQHPWSY